ncbi:MAG: hypothetical protein ACRC0L_09730 [Angustibacter sp.]
MDEDHRPQGIRGPDMNHDQHEHSTSLHPRSEGPEIIVGGDKKRKLKYADDRAGRKPQIDPGELPPGMHRLVIHPPLDNHEADPEGIC